MSTQQAPSPQQMPIDVAPQTSATSEQQAQQIVLNQWEDDLCSIMRARMPGVVVQSLEEERVIDSIIRITQWMYQHRMGLRKISVWSPVSSYEYNNIRKPEATSATRKDFFPLLKEFAEAGSSDEMQRRAETLVLCDVSHLLGEGQPGNIRMMRECLDSIRGTYRTIVILGRGWEIPDEIAADLKLTEFELPTVKELERELSPIVAKFQNAPEYQRAGVRLDAALVAPFSRACAGLTEMETRSLLSLSVARFRGFDARSVDMALKEKAQLVRRSNVLEYVTPKRVLADVGGLERVKSWINEYDSIYSDMEAAKKYGLRPASGVVYLGIPGCGKSLLAEALAGHWRLPLLKLDVGKLFGSLVGQSEANVDQMIRLAKACRPCIVFIDEIEKALGGSGGELDGGTSSRVKGKLLTWLQEKPEEIFVVATANDVKAFNKTPELLRAGRFDSIFFVDLPDKRSRIEILSIHLRKRGHNIPLDSLVEAAGEARGYSGAELEVVVQTAIRAAFNSKPRPEHPTSEQLQAAIRTVVPLSHSMGESIRALRDWAKGGKAIPAGATLEDDKSDDAAFTAKGLPMVRE